MIAGESMNRTRRIIEWLSNIAGYFSAVLVPIMMAIVMYEVFMRYVIGQAPGFADEISAYMLVAIAFTGLAYTWKEKGHVRVEALITRLPKDFAKWLRLGGLILALAFVVLVSKICYEFLIDTYTRGIMSVTQLRIPMLWPRLPLAVGFSLLSLQLIVEIVKAVIKIRSATGEEAI